MIVLGLSFGHDASAAVVVDGQVVANVQRERLSRIKKAMGLDRATVFAALEAAGVGPGEVDVCALVSTQGVPWIWIDDGWLGIRVGRSRGHRASCPGDLVAPPESRLSREWTERFLGALSAGAPAASWPSRFYYRLLPEARAGVVCSHPPLDRFVEPPDWNRPKLLGQLANDVVASFAAPPVSRRSLASQALVTLEGREIRAYAIHHHLAHAASSFYLSPFERALVLTHDGFSGQPRSLLGLAFLGEGSRLRPITSHGLGLGALYDRVGIALGMGDTTPAGKLMGLAGWGTPSAASSEFVGSADDWSRLSPESEDVLDRWMAHCRRSVRESAEGIGPHHWAGAAPSKVSAEIAASTQWLFEEIRLQAIRALRSGMERCGALPSSLCLSGGTALNCPSNTRIYRESGFERLFVEPICDDSGLAVGAALAVEFQVEEGVRESSSFDAPPYWGPVYSGAALESAVRGVRGDVEISQPAATGASVAEDCYCGRVVGFFAGRSEAGPRALGHRSILADPRCAEMAAKVNEIKGRELWRPLAPAVLETASPEWFADGPRRSPCMLFTHRVLKPDEIPAVTHADGSARAQTVGREESPGLWSVLREFERLSSVPVLLNTSLNGPGEPMVESPQDAVRFFNRSGLDVLYVGPWRLSRRGPGDESIRSLTRTRTGSPGTQTETPRESWSDPSSSR